MNEKELNKLQERWVKEVYDADQELIDPGNNHDWRSLLFGFLIGAGMTPKQAEDQLYEDVFPY